MQELEAIRALGVTPHALANRPSLPLHLQVYLDGFYTLSRSRGFAAQAGFLPLVFSEICKWCDEAHILTENQRDRAICYIQATDGVFIEHTSKQLKNKPDVAGKKPVV